MSNTFVIDAMENLSALEAAEKIQDEMDRLRIEVMQLRSDLCQARKLLHDYKSSSEMWKRAFDCADEQKMILRNQLDNINRSK